MKKVVLAFAVVAVIVIALVYIFLPKNFVVSSIKSIPYKPAVVLRSLHENANWQHWFPARNEANTFSFNDYAFKLGKKTYAAMDVTIERNNKIYNSSIHVLPYNADSSLVQWQVPFEEITNPFKRIEAYRAAKELKLDMDTLLGSFKTFTQSTKNIYGFNIQRTTLTDTALVSIKTVLKQYPSIELIYSLIDRLKNYVKEQHAAEHNYPMLNVTQLQDGSYEVMVGIPTNVPLAGTDLIKPKRMMMLKDKTLVTDVTGDNSIIQKALSATGSYMSDNALSSPVIPFQQLITDRSKEQDSTKWITKIFTPFSD